MNHLLFVQKTNSQKVIKLLTFIKRKKSELSARNVKIYIEAWEKDSSEMARRSLKKLGITRMPGLYIKQKNAAIIGYENITYYLTQILRQNPANLKPARTPRFPTDGFSFHDYLVEEMNKYDWKTDNDDFGENAGNSAKNYMQQELKRREARNARYPAPPAERNGSSNKPSESTSGGDGGNNRIAALNNASDSELFDLKFNDKPQQYTRKSVAPQNVRAPTPGLQKLLNDEQYTSGDISRAEYSTAYNDVDENNDYAGGYGGDFGDGFSAEKLREEMFKTLMEGAANDY